MPLAAALARVTTAPLRVLGLPGGSLAAGEPADICVFDPDHWWRVEPAALQSQGKNTPLLGFELRAECAIPWSPGKWYSTAGLEKTRSGHQHNRTPKPA